jgi:hypothetical protein
MPIDLASLGLSSGMKVTLRTAGTVCYFWDGISCQIGPSIPWSVAGVFSSTSQLGSSNMLNRVTGAIASDGLAVFTLPTFDGNFPTDIPQDFSIAAIGSPTIVTIPNGAKFLFFNINDSFFGDNLSTDLELHVAAVPEPATFLLLVIGGPVIARFRRKIAAH